MNKVLPIKPEHILTAECGLFYRLSILLAYPNMQNWIYNHFHTICMDKNNNIYFGYQDIKCNTPLYFNNVLKSNELNWNVLTPRQLLYLIEAIIDNGQYFQMFCDEDIICSAKDMTFSVKSVITGVREILIFGYDREKKQFLALIYKNHTFKKSFIPYNILCYAYELLQNYLIYIIKNPFSILPKVHITSSVSVIYNKSFFLNINALYADILKDIKSFYNWTKGISSDFFNGSLLVQQIYIFKIEEAINGATEKILLRENLNVLYEHWHLFRMAVQHFSKTYIINFSSNLLLAFSEVENTLQKSLSLAIKFEFDADATILKKIHGYLSESLPIKHKVLMKLLFILKKYRSEF